MSQAPLLSVCIPTLNRLAFLRESLEVLLPEADALGIEVCICDNASSDGTPEYLSALSARYPAVCLLRQPVKVAIDRNMLAAIGMASGRYVLPLGDDDVMVSSALVGLLASLDERVDLLVLNGWHTDAQLIPAHPHLDASLAGRRFDDPEAAFEQLWDKMPFGSFLAARECFDPNLAERYVGTSHAYAGVVWDALAIAFDRIGAIRVRCGEAPVVLLRGAEKTWRANSAQILFEGIPGFFTLVARSLIYTKTCARVSHAYLERQTRFRELLHLRSLGLLRPRDLSMLSRDCNPAQALRMRLVAHLPKTLLRLPMAFARSARGVFQGRGR